MSIASVLEGTTQEIVSVVLDALPSPVFIKDVKGRFLAVNRAYEQVSGLRREAIVGITVHDIYPRDLADRYAEADLALYAGKAMQIYEVPMVVAGGARRDMVVSKSIFMGADGQVVGLIGSFTDVTAMREVERALKDANERLEERVEQRTQALARANTLLTATLESTADGILAVDGSRRIVAYNERFLALWGIDPTVARRGDDAELLRGVLDRLADPAGFIQRIDELYALPDEQAFDVIELADGRRFERYSRSMRVPGEAPGRVWSFRDMTRERQLEAEMRHAQKMEAVGRLAGSVAHDFNNLLTIILSNTAFVVETLEENHPAQADIAEIESVALRAAELTKQLLTFSRKQVVAARSIDLNRVLAEMVRMLGRLLGASIAVEVDCDPELGPIRADPSQIEQVIANLCVNARDAMPDGGRLVIKTRNIVTSERLRPEAALFAGVELTIADTGVGMSPEVLEHIFEPFFTTKERGKGTGLGLSTVFGIVTQAGGSIDVESSPGKGTTFRVVLPRTEVEDGALPSRAPRSSATRHATILLVEDEAALRRAAARQLCRAGHSVVEAADGRDAALVAAGHARPFDLLLTDVVMPFKSGATLARELLGAEKVRRVLFMTGFVDDLDQLPADAVIIAKPFQLDALLAKVEEVLQGPPVEPPEIDPA